MKRLLNPRSLAVIGGSWAQNVVAQSLAIGFTGELWPVNPAREHMAGVPCYNSLSELPGIPDAAFVGINRDDAIPAIAQLAQMGCGGAVCFASGFSEAAAEDATAHDREAALLAAAGHMPLLGPNCYGLINYLDQVAIWPDQHGGVGALHADPAMRRGVGVITQSSNIAINISMQQRGLPLACLLTVGNQAQIGVPALARALLADERISALGLYLEGLQDLRAWETLAVEAARQGKPIVVIKTGASEQSRRAVISHTNSIAGSDAAATALLARLGCVRVASVDVLIECLKIAHVHGALASADVQSLSCSGGEAALMADTGARHGLHYPPLTEEQKLQLRRLLGPQVALANPLDYHTYIWGDEQRLRETFTAMCSAKAAFTMLVLDYPRADRCDDTTWAPAVDAFCQAAATTRMPAGILASLPENMPEHRAAELLQRGVVPMCGLEQGLAAVSALAATTSQRRFVCGRSYQPVLVAECAAGKAVMLTEDAAKSLLSRSGITVPAGAMFATAEQLRKALPASGYDATSGTADGPSIASERLQRVPGYPVALKAQGLEHKTEMGAVATGLRDSATLHAALSAMEDRLHRHGVAHSGYLVEQMVEDAVAELLISVVRDDSQCFLLTIAAGGTQTELLRDSAHLLVPATEQQIRDAIGQLRVNTLLQGYRGQPAANMQSVVQAILALQSFVERHKGGLTQVEINPLLCGQQQAVAVDALVEFQRDAGTASMAQMPPNNQQVE